MPGDLVQDDCDREIGNKTKTYGNYLNSKQWLSNLAPIRNTWGLVHVLFEGHFFLL